jgi:hypothetical protein
VEGSCGKWFKTDSLFNLDLTSGFNFSIPPGILFGTVIDGPAQLWYQDAGLSSNNPQINGYTDGFGPYHRVSYVNGLKAIVEGSNEYCEAYSDVFATFSLPN